MTPAVSGFADDTKARKGDAVSLQVLYFSAVTLCNCLQFFNGDFAGSAGCGEIGPGSSAVCSQRKERLK
jgi:hypothetical protein